MSARSGLSPRGALRRAGSVAALLAAAAVFAPAADAQVFAPTSPWAAIELASGSTQADGALADYRWDTLPKAGFGAGAMAGAGRFAGGVRLWTTRTAQAVDAPGAPASVHVRSTSLELVARGRVLTIGGVALSALASGGRLWLGYGPDRLAIDTGGGTVEVAFAPIHEWIAGGGFALERGIGPRWSAGVEVERRVFGLDTAHRSGGSIVEGRESFGDWSARVTLARRFAWR